MPNELNKALLAFQKEAPTITLDGQNPHFKSKYPSLGGIMEKIRPVLAKHGLVVRQMPTVSKVSSGDGDLVATSPALTTQIVHAASGDFVESTMLLLPAKMDPQGQGSALTYARRYMVLAMLGLVGDEDDDGNAASKKAESGAGSQSPLIPAGAAIGFKTKKQKDHWHRLLKTAGLDSTQNEAVTRYAESIDADRISAAMDWLSSDDTEQRDKATAALLRMADEWAQLQSDVPYDKNA